MGMWLASARVGATRAEEAAQVQLCRGGRPIHEGTRNSIALEGKLVPYNVELNAMEWTVEIMLVNC